MLLVRNRVPVELELWHHKREDKMLLRGLGFFAIAERLDRKVLTRCVVVLVAHGARRMTLCCVQERSDRFARNDP